MSYDPSPPHPPHPYAYAPHPSSPPHPYAPHAPHAYAPHPSSPPHPTYPWQSPEPRPEPARRLPRRAALGHHSDLRMLRRAYRLQRRVAALTALGYFTLFLVLSAFAPSLMAGEVTGGLPAGLLLALAQLPVTWLATALYEHTARRYVDPIANLIRKQAELDAKREATR
ncbi:DUF485 domain-containing protein [Streptomyces sp. JNUCC 63]